MSELPVILVVATPDILQATNLTEYSSKDYEIKVWHPGDIKEKKNLPEGVHQNSLFYYKYIDGRTSHDLFERLAKPAGVTPKSFGDATGLGNILKGFKSNGDLKELRPPKKPVVKQTAEKVEPQDTSEQKVEPPKEISNGNKKRGDVRKIILANKGKSAKEIKEILRGKGHKTDLPYIYMVLKDTSGGTPLLPPPLEVTGPKHAAQHLLAVLHQSLRETDKEVKILTERLQDAQKRQTSLRERLTEAEKLRDNL